MQHFLLLCFVVGFVCLQGKAAAHPQPQDEDYASYANLYPEIAKKIGEEPIEIIDVVKSVVVYDSDDVTPMPDATPEPDSEAVNETIPGESFMRSMKKNM